MRKRARCVDKYKRFMVWIETPQLVVSQRGTRGIVLGSVSGKLAGQYSCNKGRESYAKRTPIDEFL